MLKLQTKYCCCIWDVQFVTREPSKNWPYDKTQIHSIKSRSILHIQKVRQLSNSPSLLINDIAYRTCNRPLSSSLVNQIYSNSFFSIVKKFINLISLITRMMVSNDRTKIQLLLLVTENCMCCMWDRN